MQEKSGETALFKCVAGGKPEIRDDENCTGKLASSNSTRQVGPARPGPDPTGDIRARFRLGGVFRLVRGEGSLRRRPERDPLACLLAQNFRLRGSFESWPRLKAVCSGMKKTGFLLRS
ncbi:hypothetical protein NL676_026329 [Syzygium grande]|nr:hypothetical protein NL676_026329 [Syzygium grande]